MEFFLKTPTYRFRVKGRKRMLSNTMISYITQRMPWKGCLCISIVSAFPCGRVKTIGIRHVWTRIFSKTEPIFVYKNTRILVYGALKKVQCHKKLHLSIVNGSIWWSNYLVTTQTRQVSKAQFTLLLSPRYISIRKRNVKQRRRRKREGLKKTMLFSTLGAFLCRSWPTTKRKCRIL